MKDENKFQLIKMLKNSNSRLLSLCSNLLDLSRLRKETEIRSKKQNLRSLIKNAITEYKNFEDLISVNIAPSVPKFIHCDEEKILQVLRNLLDNAIKYGKESNIKVNVTNLGKSIPKEVQDARSDLNGERAERTEEYVSTRGHEKSKMGSMKSEGYIEFSISDSGIGIPNEELYSIFNPFEQSSRTKTGAGGTGLGLAICKKILERHKGKIWAQNNKKKGATFFFTLPKNAQ